MSDKRSVKRRGINVPDGMEFYIAGETRRVSGANENVRVGSGTVTVVSESGVWAEVDYRYWQSVKEQHKKNAPAAK